VQLESMESIAGAGSDTEEPVSPRSGRGAEIARPTTSHKPSSHQPASSSIQPASSSPSTSTSTAVTTAATTSATAAAAAAATAAAVASAATSTPATAPTTPQTKGLVHRMADYIPEGVWRNFAILWGACLGSLYEVGPDRKCLPRHHPHCRTSFLDVN